MLKKNLQTQARGIIKIQTSTNNDAVVITVADDGAGISEENKSKIVDPFFTTKEVGKGSGQGLATAYSGIVDKHHGTIIVSSTLGEGSVFTITLPLNQND